MHKQITAVILTYNEEANIERTLNSLTWAQKVVVLDSFSDDRTPEICQGFENVSFQQRRFTHHAEQWNHAIAYADTQWILTLDADHIVSEELRDELKELTPSADTSVFWVSYDYAVDGHILSKSLYPQMKVFFKKGAANFFQDGHTQRLQTLEENSVIGQLTAKVIHDDRKSKQRWLSSQHKYATLEVNKLRNTPHKQIGWKDKLRKVPFLAPILMPFYLLIYCGLWRDGMAGVKYVKQRIIAEWILQQKLLTKK